MNFIIMHVIDFAHSKQKYLRNAGVVQLAQRDISFISSLFSRFELPLKPLMFLMIWQALKKYIV